MEDTCYLVLKKTGVVRLTKKPPALDRGEIGVQLNVQVPEEHFYAPFVVCNVDVPEPAVIHPTVQIDPVI